MKKMLLIALLATFVLSSCTMRLADLTIASTKNVNIGEKYVKIGPCEGDDHIIIVVFPLGITNIENAIDECLANTGGDLLTNVVMEHYSAAFIVGMAGYQVRGDSWKRAEIGDLMDPTIEKYSMGQDGDMLILESGSGDRAVIYDPQDENTVTSTFRTVD